MTGHQAVLPAVVLQYQVSVAVLLEPVPKFWRDTHLWIHFAFDWPLLTDQRLKFRFPILCQRTGFYEIPLR